MRPECGPRNACVHRSRSRNLSVDAHCSRSAVSGSSHVEGCVWTCPDHVGTSSGGRSARSGYDTIASDAVMARYSSSTRFARATTINATASSGLEAGFEPMSIVRTRDMSKSAQLVLIINARLHAPRSSERSSSHSLALTSSPSVSRSVMRMGWTVRDHASSASTTSSACST